MTILLSIETSSECASVALIKGDDLFSRESSGVITHSEKILPMVQSVCEQAHIHLSDCDAIAFGAGPGSFTGVRTACGVAQGLAYGLQLPVVPVCSLLAIAQACLEKDNATNVLVMIDARMGEVYWAQYTYQDGAWQVLIAPTLSAPNMVAPQYVDGLTVCGNGLSTYIDLFAGHALLSNGLKRLDDAIPHASAVARIAAPMYAAGQSVLAHQAQPIYLRNNIAKTTAERLAQQAKI